MYSFQISWIYRFFIKKTCSRMYSIFFVWFSFRFSCLDVDFVIIFIFILLHLLFWTKNHLFNYEYWWFEQKCRYYRYENGYNIITNKSLKLQINKFFHWACTTFLSNSTVTLTALSSLKYSDDFNVAVVKITIGKCTKYIEYESLDSGCHNGWPKNQLIGPP